MAAIRSCCVYTTKLEHSAFECELKMDGLFEANRLVEVSMSKLSCLHKGGELPLRKTLMISKVLNKAQNIATSAHYSLLQTSFKTPTRNSSSKLLASITKKVETSSSSCFEDDPLPQPVSTPVRTTPKASTREPSPIVSCLNVSRLENGEEAMDFEGVNSVLCNILSESDMPPSTEATSRSRVSSKNDNSNKSTRSAAGSTFLCRPNGYLSDVSNTLTTPTGDSWNAWRFETTNTVTDTSSTWRWTGSAAESEDVAVGPLSPGKRHHQEAFPTDEKENTLLADGLLYDDIKRFKSCPPEGCPLESLPGFCGYLSPKNLQSAPLITYMFGKGFTEPSNPSISDWPTTFSPRLNPEQSKVPAHTDNHFTPHFQTSAMKFSPILAF